MTTADKLVSGKFQAEMARAILGDVDAAVTATGSTSSDAYTVRAAISVVTAGAVTTGLILPALNKGDTLTIVNYSGSDKYLYPASGGKLNNGTADDSAILVDGATAIVTYVSTINVSVLSNGLGA